MKKILKNSRGQYFTVSNGNQTTTPNLDLAVQFADPARAAQRASAYNRDFDDNMQPVEYDTEVLSYYPDCIYHATGELDAKKYVAKVHRGEADGQYDKAHAVRVQGLWFVYGRKERAFA